MKRSVVGILAHVDAGKTTLTEAMLYKSGNIVHLGRVDKKDAFLDTHSIERERGITVFSKQAMLELANTVITIIDTPGHIDFSAEAERALSIQDYAILVVSAPEGVMAHTKTLYNLLSERKIPTVIFVNKMDIAGRRRIDIFEELRRSFGMKVCDFNSEYENKDKFYEEIASASENLMNEYFESGKISEGNISLAIQRRQILPTIFGTALKCEGVDYLLSLIDRYTLNKKYSDTLFGAKVYKIATDPLGTRLTYLKVTGGKLSLKDTIRIIDKDGTVHEEKVEGIRLYSADKFKNLKTANSGMVCAVTGLNFTKSGMGLGTDADDITTLEGILDYKMIFSSANTDVYKAFLELKILAEEEPSLNLRYDTETKQIRLKLMGDIQTEVLTRVIKERFGFDVSFGDGNILYKETITEKVYGAGHFEPLMHYAEVRLRLEPLPFGSGLVFTTNCPSDNLRTNWQRLILSHLEERKHKGVLTGSPITDMKITLIAGRAHPKHTEGGDFRQATFRALRQGLMKAESILLEPTFNFTLDIPSEYLGRAMTDISNMHGDCSAPEFTTDNRAVIRGNCPVCTMRSYAKEIRAYTRGEGKLTLSTGEYLPCHNAEEIIAQRCYSPELDSSVTADSVFCKGGAGYSVPWYEADEKMHTENPEQERNTTPNNTLNPSDTSKTKTVSYRTSAEEDKELMRIFESTYGKIKPRRVYEKIENSAPKKETRVRKPKEKGEDYLIIDGYNLIFAWDDLKKLAEQDLSHARDTLIHLMCNYQGFKRCNLILVFDAYKRKDNEGSLEEIGGISVVYTKERQTADAYIEKTTYSLSEKNSVRVVTSDYEEQLIVLGNGAARVSAREFIEEVETTASHIREIIGN